MTERFDAIIVGLGSAGGVIAEQLTQAGLRVLAIEKGAAHGPEDFTVTQDEMRYHQNATQMTRLAEDPVTWRPNATTQARMLPWSSGPFGQPISYFGQSSTGTGGGTLHGAASSYRFRESDFEMRSAIVNRFGAAAIPDGSTLADWPITYADLEPYYERVEHEQGVSGRGGNVNGVPQKGGNPFDPFRARDYPMPPVPQGPGDVPFVEATTRLGLHPFRQPVAINSEEYRGRPACVNCGFCHGYPCHVGAKSGTHITSIPAAQATGNLVLLSLSRVLRINRSANGKQVRGVTFIDSEGEEREATARAVILSAHALQNVRLLLVSGINATGQVGKNFMTHNFGRFTSVLPVVTNPFIGSANASSAVDDFTSELVPDNDLGVLWGSPIMSVAGDLQPIEAYHRMDRRVKKFGLDLKHWMRDNYRFMHRMYSQTTNFPHPQYFCDLDPLVKDRWGQPALRVTHDWTDQDANSVALLGRYKQHIAREMGATDYWMDAPRPQYHLSTHDVGMHRMGENPATSVTDVYGEVHGCSGLYAVGGGQFVSYGGYNPNETIQALAYLTADHLIGEYSASLAQQRISDSV